MVDYNEIKEKKFIDLQHILKITTARQLSNPITIGMFDRFAGGN